MPVTLGAPHRAGATLSAPGVAQVSGTAGTKATVPGESDLPTGR
ncbi:hypothetical protein ACFPM0_26035 [Pseudonocardia sulfidoxydans]